MDYDVLLFSNNVAPYMVKSSDALKLLYKITVHVTCTSRELHRIAEQFLIQFPKVVNKLIANTKRVFEII